MASLYAAYASWASELSNTIVEYSNPGLSSIERPNAGWPLVKLEHALIALFGYLLWVAYGVFKMTSQKKQRGPSGEENKKSGGIKEASLTYAAVLSDPSKYIFPTFQDPIRGLQAIYNAFQVCLSGYMAIAAIYYAYGAGYGVICNPFETQEKNITFVQWLFYFSKVRCLP